MANKNIKGITIEINGDVTRLDKALGQVDKDLSTTQKNLKEVERLLKLDPKNVELLDQKQRLLAQGVEQTSKRYETLKKTLDSATASNVQIEKWEKAQSSLQGQITRTENALSQLIAEQRRMEGLNFAPDSTEMVNLQREIDDTREKSEALRAQAQQTFEELGRPISIDQYDALQRELVQAKADMDGAAQAAKEFESGADQMNDAMGDAGGTAGELEGVLGKLGISLETLTMAGVVGLAVEAIKALVEWTAEAVKGAAEYADNILTLSTNFGIATDKLQEYTYMAELVDTDVNTITGSISRLTRNMDAARGGTGDAAEAFAKLNIRVTGANGELRNSSEVFEEAIGALSMIHNETERDAIAMTLFGRSAMDLNSLIAAMADGSFKDLQQEARELGYVLSDEELATLGAVDDQFQRLDKTMEMAKNRLAIELAPQIMELTEKLLDLAKTIDWEKAGSVLGNLLQTAIDLLGPLADGLAATANGVLAIADAATSAAAAVSGLFSKLGNSGIGKALKGIGSGYLRSALPFFAEGGVVEPNSPMLAVVGDNKTEREIISPRSEMVSAVREAMGGGAGGAVHVTLELGGTDDQIIRALAPKLRVYNDRLGVTL